MKRIITTLSASALAVATFVMVGSTPSVGAQGATQAGAEAARGTGVPGSLFGDAGIVTTVTNVLLYVVGALAVIMIIWGGIRYVTSAGNSSNVTAAKNTIMYAIIGLIVAFLAFAAVNWVLGAISPGGAFGATSV